MEPSALHSQIAVFDKEDNSLYFALGLAYAASQILAWLEVETAQTNNCLSNLPQEAGKQAAEAGELTDFLLGLISFSQHYHRSLAISHADLLQDVLPNPPAVAPSQTRLVIRDLLV